MEDGLNILDYLLPLIYWGDILLKGLLIDGCGAPVYMIPPAVAQSFFFIKMTPDLVKVTVCMLTKWARVKFSFALGLL